VSYHALAGARGRLASNVSLLVDGGLGISQQATWHLGLFGGKQGFETEGFAPSAAARVQLVCELGRLIDTRVGLALAGDVRSTLDASAALGTSVGLGFYVAN